MPAHELILGTAGHIDHGKTALIRALTGVDTDRLEEEKARGISIDLGFAHLDLGGRRVGVVDVPGHERFIRNMLAGASGIDVGLLVVAADDSVMPQTREHLAILEFLQVPAGLVVITKSDLAEPDWLDMVEEDVRELVRGTFLENAPVVRTSSTALTGLDDLRETLAAVCAGIEPRRAADLFRLHVDRAFVLQGLGTLVTGTVWSGAARAGDELDWLPPGRRVRLRSIQSHGEDVEVVHQGQRAALNVSGAKHSEVVRGHVIAAPGFLRAARTITVRLHALAESPWPIRHRSTVRLHVGTQEVMARLWLLEGTVIEPGASGFAQLNAAEPVVAGGRQPFVIRAESPLRTIGGGIVLQPAARRISRRDHVTIERLPVLEQGSDLERAAEVVFLAGFEAVAAIDLCREIDVSRARAAKLLGKLGDKGLVETVELGPRRVMSVHVERLADLRGRIVATLQKLHGESSVAAAVQRQRVAQRLDYVDPDLVMAVVDRMLAEGALAGDEKAIALPGHTPVLTNAQEKLRAEVIRAYRSAGFSPPEPAELARSQGVGDEDLRPIIQLCVSQDDLAHLEGTLYLHREWEGELRKRLRATLAERPGLTVAEIRDLLKTSRKYAVPFCEYLDRIGVTRREDDRRVLA